MVDLLTDNITSGRNLKEIQNQSVDAQFANRLGVLVCEFSVESEMARLGVSALPVGDYYVEIPDLDPDNAGTMKQLGLPDNAILMGLPILHVHKAKAGSGTIAIAVGAVAMDTALNTVGVTADDDGAGNALVRGRISAAAEPIKFTVAGDTVTAGSCTLLIEYMLGSA